MLKTDFQDEDSMREHCMSIYEKAKQARQARRLLPKMDIAPGRANSVKFKGFIQWMDSVIEELTFED
tara:strand:- start:313 stop:513 length:201 start_codon:yes stop_codon:yes gene_type:complete